MFKLIVVCVLFAIVAANDEKTAEITELKSDVRADGFEYLLKTSNGIQQSASGDEHGNVKGASEWESPEGQHIKIDYTADENGYQPSSDVLPTPPPVPEAILKAIAYINAHPSVEH